VGFVDAEGNFGITVDSRGFFKFVFRIRLHIDDIDVLRFIKSMLGVGNVRAEGQSCIYSVDALSDIVNVILPIFQQYPLHTSRGAGFLLINHLFRLYYSFSIMRDVNYGWLVRYLHANTASFFFICMYIHMAKGLYYGSYRSPRILLWSIGVIIFLLTIIIAFLGKINCPIWSTEFLIDNFLTIQFM